MQPSSQSRNRRHSMRLLLLLVLLGSFAAWSPLPASARAEQVQDVYNGTSYVALQSEYSRSVPQSLTASAVYASQSDVPAPSDVSQGGQRYFAQTAHFLRGIFLSYWQTHGGAVVLGLPITEPVVEDGLTVQYLERARLEYHPEIAGSGASKVLLTRLGVTLAEERGLHFDPRTGGSNTPTSVFFTETGHNLANGFMTYWQRNGGLAVFGYPISEEFTETNQADGKIYTVQYFERNRFEWHPEVLPPSNIQLGLLGVEYARSNSIDPLARVMLPSPLPAADADLSDDPRLVSLVDADLLPAVRALGRTAQFRWVPAVIIQNKVVVQFTQISDEGVGGAFVFTGDRSQRYTIVVPERYRGEPVEAIASVLAHESTHAFDFTSGVVSQRTNCSIEEELRAYKNGLASWVALKGPGALAASYTPGTFEYDINGSLVGFNNGQTQLGFDLDLAASRAYLRELYGASCGP